MARHLVLRLKAPLAAFGGEAIDSRGVTAEFPALSMLTGLIANALGWDRGDDQLHDHLQQRLRVGSLLEPGASRLQDFQTAELAADDKGWTTSGAPEVRRGGAGSYTGPHLRFRDYHADLRAWILIRLEPAQESPSLDDIARALDRPVRPLFIGRKPCLPADRLVAGWEDAEDILSGIRALLKRQPGAGHGAWRAQWPEREGVMPAARRTRVCDERNWTSGVHGGWRHVLEADLAERLVEAA